MKNEKTLWKSSAQILLCLAPLFFPSLAYRLTADELTTHVFGANDTDFESTILSSLQTTKNFFAQDKFTTGNLVALLATTFTPLLNQMAGVISVMRSLLASESDWKRIFSKTSAYETKREIAADDIRWIQASMSTIESKFTIISESNPYMENRRAVASIIHTEIDKILNFFATSDSLFKRYPLIGTPPLTTLAQLVAFFDPMAKMLNPFEAKNLDLSCKMRDILLDYRPRAVYARLEKLHVEAYKDKFLLEMSDPTKVFSNTLLEAMSIGYNQHGYSINIHPTVRCRRLSVELRKELSPLILKDDFGIADFDLFHGDKCYLDYALLVRHKVEEMYPVELFHNSCVNPKNKTGFGWLTMKLRKVSARYKQDGYVCDFTIASLFKREACDPLVRLFIDGKMVLETLPRNDLCCYNVDATFISTKISKNAWIKISVLDADLLTEELVLATEGSVESFLKRGYREGTKRGRLKVNFIDTFSFWQDEYK